MPFDSLDVLTLSRIQFAASAAGHIIFPSLSIGLSIFLVYLQAQYLRTKQDSWLESYKFWRKIFALSFGSGVVTGVVMSFLFGTNFPGLTKVAGDVIGPLMTLEVLTAFFMEATFLGIMLFGMGRLPMKVHFLSTVMVAVGTIISAFWILSVNSWMQTPVGVEFVDGKFVPKDWMAIVFNPSFPYRFAHMLNAALLTACFFAIAVMMVSRLKAKDREHQGATPVLKHTLIMAFVLSVAQIVIGDFHGLNTLEHQPMKVAAMEGQWERQNGAPLRLFAIPRQAEEKNDFEIAIPKLQSLVLMHDANAQTPALKDVPPEDRPPVIVVFYAFRLMIGVGLAMVAVSAAGIWFSVRKAGDYPVWFKKACVVMLPSGWIATIAGWCVTEVGRQPWTVYGYARTANLVSDKAPSELLFSLLSMGTIYALLTAVFLLYTIRLSAQR
jgi:cytochrome d ubiquinol oxidase subunit I